MAENTHGQYIRISIDTLGGILHEEKPALSNEFLGRALLLFGTLRSMVSPCLSVRDYTDVHERVQDPPCLGRPICINRGRIGAYIDPQNHPNVGIMAYMECLGMHPTVQLLQFVTFLESTCQ